ncbi:MAG: rhodanese-like domain-containing protein [Chloroflexi bacterium]|nr:rhodanese-like domain-containing protein [Chloroflexota bacterium]
MKEISAEELKAKIDSGDDFRLVMTLGDLAFKGKHIPGSIDLHEPKTLLSELDPSEDIVVYCSDRLCPASMMAYHYLEGQGYKNVRRFSGGLTEWEKAGNPLLGELVEDD